MPSGNVRLQECLIIFLEKCLIYCENNSANGLKEFLHIIYLHKFKVLNQKHESSSTFCIAIIAFII